MIRFVSFLSIIILLSSCKKEDEGLRNGYFWLYRAGFKDLHREEAANGISEKWKIKWIDAGDCTIDYERQEKIIKANKKTRAAIENKYGKDWEVRYNKDVEDFMMKRVDVMDVLIINKLFRNKLREYNIPIDDVDKDIKELNDKGQYEVAVINPKLKYENRICFRVNVDTKNRTVNLIK
ncbi:hypothetical protein EG339_19260 [Chryseobacterium bernardetii]|uniref:Lipoprotein n=2 Tax=Chryseobacterium TaxID=59732 RepID=A0A3G6TBH5_9FLAO|nr:hypothetical protein [Chryseobacterium bernardetii]AZB26578.1 hypothetical protein EG339_19260 [Chryseobacterium bernardetii]